MSFLCHSIVLLLYYYIIILLYYCIIQLIFCRRLCQGVVTVCPTLVHPPPYCPLPCRLWRRRITAQWKTVYLTRITRALLTLIAQRSSNRCHVVHRRIIFGSGSLQGSRRRLTLPSPSASPYDPLSDLMEEKKNKC